MGRKTLIACNEIEAQYPRFKPSDFVLIRFNRARKRIFSQYGKISYEAWLTKEKTRRAGKNILIVSKIMRDCKGELVLCLGLVERRA